jgi:peptide/nickel transport system permease protein
VLRFLSRRLISMVPVLLFLTFIVFVLDQLSPVNPARAQLGPRASPGAVETLERQLWLNRPLPLQYLHYLDRVVLHADLGYSARTQNPVTTDLRHAVPATLELAIGALMIAVVLGLLLGVASAGQWRGSSIFRWILIAGASAPTFLLAILGILLFFSTLHLLPASGETSYQNTPTGPTGFLLIDALLHGEPTVFLDVLQHMILPAFCVAILPAVAVGRVLRSSLISAMQHEYVRTARSKGVTERRILLGHALRNAVGPALAMLGLQTGLMFAGVVVVETVFAWPGIGFYASEAIPVGDFPAIAGVALVIGIAYVVINATVDVLQAVADPRVRI